MSEEIALGLLAVFTLFLLILVITIWGYIIYDWWRRKK